MRRGPAALTLVAVLAAAVSVAACGSAGQLPSLASPTATATSLKIRKISDDTWGFRMAYPDGWVGTHYANPSAEGPEGTLLYVMAFADPKGAEANGSYLDSEQLAVYQLAQPMSPDDLTLESASRLIYKVILKDVTSLSPRTNVEPYKLNGMDAWRVGYEYRVGDEVVAAKSALIVRGRRAYWYTAQAETYAWRTVSLTLETCVRYFHLQ